MASLFEGGSTPIVYGTGGSSSDTWNNPWIYLIFLALFANGNGGGLFGGCGTNSTTNMINNDFLFSNLNSRLDSVNNGIIQGFSGLNSEMQGGFNAIGRGIADSTFALNSSIQGLGAQMASCCCETQKAILESGYRNDLAIQAQTSAIIAQGNANTQAILDKLCQAEIRELSTANSALQSQLATCATNNAINSALAPVLAQLSQVTKVPQPAFMVPPPGCIGC